MEIEERWTRDSKSQFDLIEKKSSQLRDAIERIQIEQDAERRARLKREGKLVEQIESHRREFEDRWNDERSERGDEISTLQAEVEKHESKRADEHADVQRRVESDLADLRREFSLEKKERQEQDDEIVAALNRYTQQLQKSLSILSSD